MKFQRIRDLREDHDKKQIELANYLEIKQSTYSDYESGKINIPIDMLIKIADFYGVTLDYLVGRSDEMLAPVLVCDTELSQLLLKLSCMPGRNSNVLQESICQRILKKALRLWRLLLLSDFDSVRLV